MALNDVYEVVLGYSQNGAKLINRLHLVQTGADVVLPGNESSAKAVLEDLWPAIQDVTASGVTLETIRSRRIFPTEGGSYILNVAQPGDVGQDPLPPNAVAEISFYTTLPTRSGRGRIHLSGVPETFTQDGVFTDAAIAAYGAVTTALLTAMQSGADATFRAGIYHVLTGLVSQFVSGVIRSHTFTLRSRRMSNP